MILKFDMAFDLNIKVACSFWLNFYGVCIFFVCPAVFRCHNLKVISLNLQRNSGKSDGKETDINDAD